MKRKRKDLKIPYGVSDFRTIRNEGLYYVDKTQYLAQMEARDRFIFFVRPRRFGKSLFFYYGLLSMVALEDNEPVFGVPNACIEKQMCDYLRSAYMPPGKDWPEDGELRACDGDKVLKPTAQSLTTND